MSLIPFFVNNVSTTLSAAATSTATTLSLSSTTNLPSSIPTGFFLPLTLNDVATGLVYEIVYVTAISGSNVTVERAQEGTGTQAWNTGDYIRCSPTAGTVAAINGSASEAFTANGFTSTDFFTSTGSAAFLENANYSASVNVGNTGYIEHYVAPATNAQAAVNLGQFPSSLGGNGWKKYPDPNSPSGYFIEQWGDITTSSSGQINFVFPIAFPNQFLASTGTFLNNGGPNPTIVQINTSAATTTYVPVYASSTSSGYTAVAMAVWVKGY